MSRSTHIHLPNSTTTTFSHSVLNPQHCLNEAKRIVAIATAAEEEALRKAASVIRQRIKSRRTCAGYSKSLSASETKKNELIEQIARDVESLILDDVPF